ncbi:MAG: ribonuclease P protein subunit [Methanomicrobiales archaeon]|jgi:ribonuclease P protein subunit POP4|nr:ribonuclease P protein subunit [Methanomicrobiales archaeon]
MISAQNVNRHEMIGLDVLVVSSTNPVHIGIQGIIIDETKNTFKIRTPGRILTVQKRGCTFRLNLSNTMVVDLIGDQVALPPERRVNLQNMR